MPTILIVDDAKIDRVLAGSCVEQLGATPIYAENGVEALERIEQQKPDGVLTDLQMPEMDGLELVQAIRRDYADVPVVLMTAHGSEEVAASALKHGAASYVPKKNLRRDLGHALRVVLDAAEAAQDRQTARQLLIESETKFVFGYQPGAVQALVSHLQNSLAQIEFGDHADLIQIGTALTEALTNALDHGNLELDSALREAPDNAYRRLGNERSEQPPYQDRRVYVTARLTPTEASYTIRDEGPGFDPSTLPDPTDPENLLLASGRGIMLIRMFMDEVSFNETGNTITMIKRRPK